MKNLRYGAIILSVFALALALYGCKKKEAAESAETAEETAAETVVAEEIPGPGEDLICDDCKELFMSEEEYAAHMEENHGEKWAQMKDKFWEVRGGEAGEEAPE